MPRQRKQAWLQVTAESNPVDYLEKIPLFLSSASANPFDWKWVTIATHAALYSFAVCAAQGTDPSILVRKSKNGKERLMSFSNVLQRCQNSAWMDTSSPLVLSPDENRAIVDLQKTFRNNFVHFTPMYWSIHIPRMQTMVRHCLEVLDRLTQIPSYAHFTPTMRRRIRSSLSRSRRALSLLDSNQPRGDQTMTGS